MRLALVSLALLPLAASAAEPPGPRAVGQAATKSALSDTRLAEEQVNEVYAEVQKFARQWGARVLEQGTAVASEDFRKAVDEALREHLQGKGMALTQQEAVIDAVRLRAEAAVEDHARMVAAQAAVKLALERSGTEEPALSDILHQVKGWAEDAHSAVEVPGVAGAGREPASLLVEREVGPLLDEHEFPDEHRAAFLKALGEWLEARAAVEGEALR